MRHTLPAVHCNLWWKAPRAPRGKKTPSATWTPGGSLRPCVQTTCSVRGQPGSSSETPRRHPATPAASWTETRPSTPRWAWLTACVDPQSYGGLRPRSDVLPLKGKERKKKTTCWRACKDDSAKLRKASGLEALNRVPSCFWGAC